MIKTVLNIFNVHCIYMLLLLLNLQSDVQCPMNIVVVKLVFLVVFYEEFYYSVFETKAIVIFLCFAFYCSRNVTFDHTVHNSYMYLHSAFHLAHSMDGINWVEPCGANNLIINDYILYATKLQKFCESFFCCIRYSLSWLFDHFDFPTKNLHKTSEQSLF